MKMISPCFTLFYDSTAIHIVENKGNRSISGGFRVVDKEGVKTFFENHLSVQPKDDVYLFGYEPKVLFKDVKNYFRLVKAAGGLVLNEKGHYLFIKRFGVWDLPKGKKKKNEKTKHCALREVMEETAVSGLRLGKELPSTYHIYLCKGKFCLKKTSWYLMSTSSNGTLKPQTKEKITEAVWLEKSQSIDAINHSYRSLKDTFSEVISS